MTEFDVSHTTSFLPVWCVSITLSCTIVELCECDVTKYRDLEILANSRSLEMASFGRSYTNSYSFSIVTMAISCIVAEIK